MKKYILKTLITAAVAYLLSLILSGVSFDSFWAAVLFAIVISLIDTLIVPFITFLTLPITFLTLGLFLLVINALAVMLADWLIQGMHVENFWWALLYSFILSIFGAAFQKEFNKNDT